MAEGGENGGNGAYWTEAATAGVDGTGGGGGGGCNASSGTRISGAGGSGIVVIRYTDFSLAGGTPVLSVEKDAIETGPVSAEIPVHVTYAGDSADSVTLSAAWGYAADDLTFGSTNVTDFIGDFDLVVDSLYPGRKYYLSITADNGLEGGSTTWTGSFTTESMFSAAPSLASSAGELSFTVDAASDGTQTLEVWVGADASSMTNQATYTDSALMAAGTHTVAPLSVGQLGETLSILVRHIAVVDGYVFTNDTDVLTTVFQDGATYTWVSTVSDGLWCDADNWTSTDGLKGWPTIGSTAVFPECAATCRVDCALTVGTTKFTKDGAITLLGTVEGASLTTGLDGVIPFPAGTWTFDAVSVARNPVVQTSFQRSGTVFQLLNGASFSIGGDQLTFEGTGISAFIGSGSTLRMAVFGGNAPAGADPPEVVVEGGTLKCTGNELNLTRNGTTSKQPVRLVVRGPDSRVLVSGTNGRFFAQHTNATVTIELEGTYSSTEALFTGTSSKVMADSGYPIAFSVPRTEKAAACETCDILVADWSKASINTELVEFGEHEGHDASFFYFTETTDPHGTRYKSAAEVSAAGATVTCLWFHHTNPCTILVVR